MWGLLILNSLLGLALFAYAWSSSYLHRNVVEERDSLYPAWRLTDTHRWHFWKLLLGAVTIMPIRIIGLFATLTFVMLSHYVLLWNVDF